MAAKRLGIAILGLGRMGQIHARNVVMSGRTRLQWLVRNDVERAERFVDSLGLRTRCTDPAHLDDVLSDDSVDAVIICSPTSAHEEQVAQCLRAGKGVLCEKPVTSQMKSTKRCYDLAEAAGVPLMCAFHRRFDPGFQGLRWRVSSGELGKLRLVKSSSHDMTPPPLQYIRTSGGIIPDSTIHDLDICQWIAQSRVRYVTAHGNAWGKGVAECSDVDLVTVTLCFHNGVIALIDNGRQAAYGYSQRLEAMCDEGSTVVYDPRETPFLVERAEGQLSSPIHSDFEHRYRQAYVNVLEHFIDVMQGKAELAVTGESTIATMKLCEAAAESLVTGKHVELNLAPKDAIR